MIKAFVNDTRFLRDPMKIWSGYSITSKLIRLDNFPIKVPAELLMVPHSANFHIIHQIYNPSFFLHFKYYDKKFHSLNWLKMFGDLTLTAELAVNKIAISIKGKK